MTTTYDDYVPTLPDRADWTLANILAWRATTHPDAVYLDVPHTGECYTYSEVFDLARRIGSGLIRRGHAKGDRVAIMLPNRSEYILSWLGTGVAGLAEVPVNTAYQGSFFEHQIRTVAPSAAIVSDALADRFVESADACRSVRRFYVVGDDASARGLAIGALRAAGFEAEPFSDLLGSGIDPLPEVRARDLASIFFTSGTTGLSKGVTMTHAHMVLEADECISLTRLTDADVYLSVGPLFHGNAQFLAAYPALLAGARFVLRERFSASRWSTWVRESGATVTNFVGVMMDFVWKQPPADDDRDNDLRCIFAAPTASSIVEGFRDRFGVEAFVEVFGLTETCMPIMTPYGAERPPGAAGKVVADWFDVRLVDPETDEEVGDGEVGELVVRARYPFTMSNGYFGMPDRTAEAMRNCWFHTGDGLRRDEHGWFYFVDRLKDSLRRRGENISSYEVEQALLQHPGVAECAVVAVPADQEAGEDEVMAFLVAAPGEAIEPRDLWEYCDRRLPYFAVPRYLRAIGSLPKTPSEKVRKSTLREIGVDGDTVDRMRVLGAMPERPL
jgi:crotonobetaine/carnitine-CoA ligase